MYSVLGASLLAGVGGTGIGGVLSVFCCKNKLIEKILYCLTAGIMLSIVCFELVPKALSMSDVIACSLFTVLGSYFVLGSERVLERLKSGKSPSFSIALAIALHNFPEGMIIGSGLSVGEYALPVLVALHDIPEGLAAALPYSARNHRAKGVLVAILSGLPTVLGAVFGYVFAVLSVKICAFVLSFSAGAMLFVIFSKIIPCSIDLKRNDFSGIIVILGIIIGLIFIGV